MVADAFDAIGFSEAAGACRAAHSLVPPEAIAGGWPACREWMETIDREAFEAMFAPYNEVIWNLQDNLEAPVAEYIRAHGLDQVG